MVLLATLPGGAYYRILGVNPVAAMVGMARPRRLKLAGNRAGA
jgi:hypothetical protein